MVHKNIFGFSTMLGLSISCNALVTMTPHDAGKQENGVFITLQMQDRYGTTYYNVSDFNKTTWVEIIKKLPESVLPHISKKKAIIIDQDKVTRMKTLAAEMAHKAITNLPIDATVSKNNNAYTLYQFAYDLFPTTWNKNQLPNPGILHLQKYIAAAQRGPSPTSRFIQQGAGLLIGAGILSTVLEKLLINRLPSMVSNKTAFAARVGVGVGLGISLEHPSVQRFAYPFYSSFVGLSPLWLAKLESLTKNNIIDGSLFIGGKEYFLSNAFNDTVSVGYTKIGESETAVDTKWQHYEIYLMPDDEHLIDLFSNVDSWARDLDVASKMYIAFIAFRPTPNVYTSHNPFTRQVLPRIIICLKPGNEHESLQDYKRFTRELIAQLYIRLKKVFDVMRETGRHPRYSEQLTPFIFAAFGGSNYKDLPEHHTVFEAQKTWYKTVKATDMAYRNWNNEQLGPWSTLEQAVYTPSIQMPEPRSTNSLFIFLDDSEKKIGVTSAISVTLLAALESPVCPILASASLITNVRHLKPLNGKNSHWIIKKINTLLYLLLPDNYLVDKKLSIEEVVHVMDDDDVITEAEYTLGLKVNHLETVTVADITKPLTAPMFADYFIGATYYRNIIFVTNNEYQKQPKATVPIWVLFMNGHGSIEKRITGLSLYQFTEWLDFLEKKIYTRLLYYVSCYAAGSNNAILYKDSKQKVDRTYPFAIITQALTDAATFFGVRWNPLFRSVQDISSYFVEFFKHIIKSDIIDYHVVADLLTAKVITEHGYGLGALPQIRFPGLPWFSVIDAEKVVSIGSILTKTRTAPLDVASFFAKKGRKSAPLGILLYTDEIPFEIIINTKTDKNLPPDIISMIPGMATHHVEKISSEVCDIESILDSFLHINGLKPVKRFFINTITGICSAFIEETFKCGIGNLASIQYVFIKLDGETKDISFMHNEVSYALNVSDGKKIVRELPLGTAKQTWDQETIIVRASKQFYQQKHTETSEGVVTEPTHTRLTPENIAKIREATSTKIQRGPNPDIS